jgi:hypothetical protein
MRFGVAGKGCNTFAGGAEVAGTADAKLSLILIRLNPTGKVEITASA